jgi:hypothetical protein
MKAKCLKVADGKEVLCSPEEAELVVIKLPQPDLGEYVDHSIRKLPVILKGQRHGTSCWSWNGDVDRPTFHPSVLTQVNYTEVAKKDFCCHSFVNDGMVQFLSDCSHEYAGKTMELLEIE